MNRALVTFGRRAQKFAAPLLVAGSSLVFSASALATATPVDTIKAKIESAGTDWVEILLVIALVIWGAWGIKLLFRK